MKRLPAALFLGFIVLFSGFSLDFGGNLDMSAMYYQDSDGTFYNSDTLYFWASSDLPAGLKIYALGNIGFNTEDYMVFDLNYLKVENREPSVLNYTVGRFGISDFSGYVVHQRIDGVSVVLNYPGFTASVKAGYTGLLFNRASGIEMTLTDQADGTDLLDLESPRIVAGAEGEFPELAGGFDVRTDVWVQFDLRDDSDLVSGGGTLDTQYFGVSLSGPVSPGLYVDGFAYLGTGSESFPAGSPDYSILSFMGSVGARYYMEQFFYSRISARFLYFSGDSDYTGSFLEGNSSGDGTVFTPVSSKSLALVFSPDPGNIMLGKLGYSIKPFGGSGSMMLKNMQAELTGTVFFRSTTGLISESGIDPVSDSLYLGTEIDGTVNFRPFSDLGMFVTGGVFVPGTGSSGAFLESQDVEFLLSAGLSFSF